MAMETGGELPNNSAYVFDNEQHSNDPFGDASLVREEELVTLSGNGAVTHDEVVASRTNMITAAALDAVMYTSAERDSRQERMDAILSQVEALEDERERLGDQVAADERQMYHTLVQARTELWETALEGGQYLTGVDVVANAVRLSPEIDEAEPVPFCETRVRVIGELSSIIEAGVPALIVQKTGEACDTYWAATPVHDGFSIVLENDSNYGAQFMLGMNGVPAVPIVEATTVETDEATPDDRSPENTVAFIEVHTGEEVGAYATGIITSKVGAITIATQDINELDNALDVINQRPQSILSELAEKTTFREGERQGLVGIIIAPLFASPQ